MSPELLALGECMVELFADGPLGEAKRFHRSYGGDTLNVLVAAARLGTSAGYITKVGDDAFADYLLSSWRAEGIDTTHARRVPGQNGLYVISLRADGERDFTYYRAGSAASTLGPEDLPLGAIRTARALHVSGISQAISPNCRAAVLAAARGAHEAGVLVSYDPNFRAQLWSANEARRAMDEVLPYVDIALPSAPEEAQALLGTSEPERIAQYFHKAGARYVGVKLAGEGGFVSVTGGESAFVPAQAPRGVVDTTGAGDAFDGAFLYGLLRGLGAASSAKLAALVSGISVGERGAIPGLPRREEVAPLAAEQGVTLL